MSASRILIADDNRLLLSTLAMLLRARGHEVLEADSGAEALDLAARSRPDAAVVDLLMPGVTGIDVAGYLNSQSVPFVFLSAYDEFDVRAASEALGARGYLLKPTSAEDLDLAIARCLDPNARATGARVQS